MNARSADQERPFPIVNVDQATAWDGEDGDDWTENEEYYNAGIRLHSRRLIEAAQIGPADQSLDVGCGCGASTREAAMIAAEGGALGVDLSSRMLARARERSRAEGLSNVRFEQADAQVYPFEEQAFDLAISRFGVMFFGDPVAAFSNIRRALRPGGRLAFLCWQSIGRNEGFATLVGALAAGRDLPRPPAGKPGQFGLADPELVRRILTEAGYGRINLDEVNEPLWVGEDADDAFSFFRSLGITRGMLRDLDGDATSRALGAIRSSIAEHDTGQGVFFGSAAWLVTAQRR